MHKEGPETQAASDPRPTGRPAVHAVGVGPGTPADMTERAAGLVADADVIVGFETVLDVVRERTDADLLHCGYDDQTGTLATFADRVNAGETGLAAFAGDPSVSGYQFLGRLERAVDDSVRVVPGVSSVQVAAARARTPLEQTTIVSMHRRGDVTGPLDRLVTAARSEHVVCLPRPGDWPAPEIAERLKRGGVDAGRTALVLERLTLPNERVIRTTVGALASTDAEFATRSLLVVRAADPTPVTGTGSMEGP